MVDLLRVYDDDELGKDGYPTEWHATIKHAVRAEAGHRCVRCHHPYRNGEHGNGEWSACDELCDGAHFPVRITRPDGFSRVFRRSFEADLTAPGVFHSIYEGGPAVIEAQWRILTVHHLDGNKANCRWWNLVPLCQRCHLTIQGRVVMDRAFMFEHSEWFKPYAAGFYAAKYLGEEIDREEALARQEELLALERVG